MKSSLNKILIIGGEGYIGSVVVNYFLEKGLKVDSFDNLTYKNFNNVVTNNYNKNYKFIYGEMSEIDSLVKFKDYSHIILLAGLVGDPITKKYKDLSIKINENQISNIISKIKDINLNFIFSSTCSNYGLRDDLSPASESDKLKPLSTYAKSKVYIEKKILSLAEKSNFIPTIFRFSTAFGLSPRMRFDLTINQFTREIALDRKLKIYDKDTWRPYCHVRDFANILYQCVTIEDEKKIKFEVFNVGIDENNASKSEIINRISKLKKNINIEISNESLDKRNYVVDFSKLKNVFSVDEFLSIDFGILEIFNMVSKNIFTDSETSEKYGNYMVSNIE